MLVTPRSPATMVWCSSIWLLCVLTQVATAIYLPRGQLCTPDKTAIRREWGEMAPAERKNYTDAVLCMTRKPPRLSTAEYSGVRSRFDDFVACVFGPDVLRMWDQLYLNLRSTHINNTLHVHYSGLFLPWHRRFTWLWEQALRQECGYTGYLPYWNWPLWTDDLKKSPLFDCSDTSLSGDGEYNPDEQPISGGNMTIPRGSGGGCVRCGPFKDLQIHLGPFSRDLTSFTEIPSPKFEYNPRCLNRSLNNFVTSHYNNANIVSRLLASTDIVDFQTVMDHWPARPDGVLGVHGGGHFSLGATMQDLFASPQDPAFMLHHCMIDRLWAMWQSRDENNRRYALNGTTNILNPPWGQPVMLNTTMEFGVLDRPRKVREVMNPTGHQLCYTYT